MKKLKNHIIINLFAGPGSGKSTNAAYLFKKFKKQGYECELITEVAKDLTYEGSHAIRNQFLISALQYHEIYKILSYWDRLKIKGILITDSPLPLGIVYQDYYEKKLNKELYKLVFSKFHPYLNTDFIFKNINIFLDNSSIKYNPIGRNETSSEALDITFSIKNLLKNNKVKYKKFNSTYQKGIFKYINKYIKDI